MTKTVAYEIHTLKDGQWQLDSVYDRKDDAMHEARRMYDVSKHILGVKIFEEEFDSDANVAASHVIFNQVRGVKKTTAKAVPAEEKKEILRSVAPPKPQKKGSATNYFLLMILGVGGIMLAIIGIAFYYTSIGK